MPAWAGTPKTLANGDVMMISTYGGLKKDDGTTVAVGLHPGHFELDGLLKEAADTLKDMGYVPTAAFVTDPCDGRTQGTTGMFDSLPYRNDACYGHAPPHPVPPDPQSRHRCRFLR